MIVVVGQRGNGFKLEKERFRSDIKKKPSTMKAVRHCHRLPREMVDTPYLEMFKTGRGL